MAYECPEMGCDCQVEGPRVIKSGAGFYIGYFCNECGPCTRDSSYFANEEEANHVLNLNREYL